MKRAGFANLLAILLWLAASSASQAAATMRVAFSSDRPPFSFHDDKQGDTGIEVDIMRAALRQMGYAMQIVIVSNKRLQTELEEGRVDIASAIHQHEPDGKGIYYSVDFVEYDNVVISKQRRGVSLRTLQDLSRHDFAIWQNGWRDLGPDFAAQYQPDPYGRFPRNYHEVPNQENQCKMFWANRVELIIIDRTVFEWFRRQLETIMPTGEAVVFHDLFPQPVGYPAAFRDAKLRDRFNQALQQLRQSGAYQSIQGRYR